MVPGTLLSMKANGGFPLCFLATPRSFCVENFGCSLRADLMYSLWVVSTMF